MARKRSIGILLLLLLMVSAIAYLPHSKAQTTTIIPGLAGIKSLGQAPVQNNPQPPVFGGMMYVANKGSDTVSVIQGTTNIANVSVGHSPTEPAFDYDSGLVYVPNTGGDTVSVLSGNALDSTVTVGQAPVTPAYDPANGYVYVPNSGGSDVSVISGTGVIATVAVGHGPMEPAVNTDPNSKYFGDVYVPNSVTDNSGMGTVTVISGSNNSVIATIELGSSPPAGAFFDIQNDYIYAGAYVISGIAGIGVLSAGSCSASTCFLDPFNGDVYSPEGTQLVVISGTTGTVVNCPGASMCAESGTFNPSNGWAYMGDAASGTSIFAFFETLYGVSFKTNGPDSYDPSTGYVYASCGGCYYPGSSHPGNVVFELDRACAGVGPGESYNSTISALCGIPYGSGNSTTTTTSNTAVAAKGTHVYTVVVSGNIPIVSGNWAAANFQRYGSDGGARVNFTLTGQDGTSGVATIKILKSEILFMLGLGALGGSGSLPKNANLSSWAPILYVDGNQVTTTSITTDSSYIYISFPIHFSAHQIELEWPLLTAKGTSTTTTQGSSSTASSGSSSTSSSSSTSTSNPSSSGSSSFPVSYLLAAAAGAVVVIGLTLMVLRKRKPARPK